MFFLNIVTLVGWFLFQRFYSVYPCQPPDYPEDGSYKPDSRKFLPGDQVVYSCKGKLTRIGPERTECKTSGRWSESTPFCDSPTKLKADAGSQARAVVDGSPNTCSKIKLSQAIEVKLATPATVHVVRIYLKKGQEDRFTKAHFEVLTRSGKSRRSPCALYQYYIDENQWVTLECSTNDFAEYLVIQDKSGEANSLEFCEIEAYVTDGGRCKKPPDRSIPNGQLEVSRSKASLRCAEGYRPVDNVRLVCENTEWAGVHPGCEEILCDQVQSTPHGKWVPLNSEGRKLSVGMQRQLQCNSGLEITGKPDVVICLKSGVWSNTTATCMEKKSSLKIIVISVGVGVAALIIFLLVLTVYLLCKKRHREVVVIHKSGEEDYTSPSICASSIEAEYSTVYYDAIRQDPLPPMTPSRPPHLQTGYSNLVGDLRPADIAFGKLKTSSLYNGMD